MTHREAVIRILKENNKYKNYVEFSRRRKKDDNDVMTDFLKDSNFSFSFICIMLQSIFFIDESQISRIYNTELEKLKKGDEVIVESIGGTKVYPFKYKFRNFERDTRKTQFYIESDNGFNYAKSVNRIIAINGREVDINNSWAVRP